MNSTSTGVDAYVKTFSSLSLEGIICNVLLELDGTPVSEVNDVAGGAVLVLEAKDSKFKSHRRIVKACRKFQVLKPEDTDTRFFCAGERPFALAEHLFEIPQLSVIFCKGTYLPY